MPTHIERQGYPVGNKASDIAERTAARVPRPCDLGGAGRRRVGFGQPGPVPLIAEAECIRLDVPAIDTIHAEFVVLVNRLAEAGPGEFGALFQELLAHTRLHFAMEEALMRETQFPGRREHLAEHGRVLGDMERFAERLAAGKPIFARAFIEDRVPAWFSDHTRTLDHDLAEHLKAMSGARDGEYLAA